MKQIMITGCNGQLGRAINRKAEGMQDISLINTDVGELDITNIDSVMKFVDGKELYAIINCAAHTAVDLCEQEEEKAYQINAIGARNLAIAASKSGAKMIHISTDYVFDGAAKNPYTEFDHINPQGAYGRSKAAGEQFVREFSDKYFILRTAWLYGEGKNFIKTMLRLSESNDSVRVVGDQIGSPTSTDELVEAIFSLLFTDNYGLFHATCEGDCSWAEFAAEIFRLAKKDIKVETITTAEYPTPAKRPAYSVLDNKMFRMTGTHTFSHWKDALENYFNKYDI